MTKEWLTVQETARYLSRGKQTIRRMVQDKRLDGKQLAPPNGKILISMASIQKLMGGNK